MTFTTGSVSSGTLRPQDLAPAFLSLLEDVSPDIIGTPVHDAFVKDVAMIVATDGEWDATGEVLDSLDDHINARLPVGLWFGANPGDGADWGVWESDDASELFTELDALIVGAEQEGRISLRLRDDLLDAIESVRSS